MRHCQRRFQQRLCRGTAVRAGAAGPSPSPSPGPGPSSAPTGPPGRRGLLRAAGALPAAGGALLLRALARPAPAGALGFEKKLKKRRVRPEDYVRSAPFEFRGVSYDGLQYYDLEDGSGQPVRPKDRVTLHYESKLGPVVVVSTRQARLLGGNRTISEPAELAYGYVPPELLKAPKRQTASGIGTTIQFDANTGDLYVTKVTRDTPAARAGLKVNDTILSIDGLPADTLTTAQVAKLLPGDPGTEVTIEYRPEGAQEVQTLTLTREEYSVPVKQATVDPERSGGLFAGADGPKPPLALYLPEAMAGMRVGGKRQIVVTPELGYGEEGFNEIPPGKNFLLEIELLDIRRA